MNFATSRNNVTSNVSIAWNKLHLDYIMHLQRLDYLYSAQVGREGTRHSRWTNARDRVGGHPDAGDYEERGRTNRDAHRNLSEAAGTVLFGFATRTEKVDCIQWRWQRPTKRPNLGFMNSWVFVIVFSFSSLSSDVCACSVYSPDEVAFSEDVNSAFTYSQ